MPAFFASVSSVKTNFKPKEYIQLLAAVRLCPFLVSAFDLYEMDGDTRNEALAALNRCRDGGLVSLMDSGNYESHWHRDSAWTEEQFFSVLSQAPAPVAFCFDNLRPRGDLAVDTEDIVARVVKAQRVTDKASIVAVVHGTREMLPALCQAVARRLSPILIALPERQLGGGITERATTVLEVRGALNALGFYVPLHLLGTGNPWSLATYSLAGADTFDGLDWCQTAADPKTGQLHHFAQADFFMDKVRVGGSFAERVLLHNLRFYAEWMAQLQEARRSGATARFVIERLPTEVASSLNSIGLI